MTLREGFILKSIGGKGKRREYSLRFLYVNAESLDASFLKGNGSLGVREEWECDMMNLIVR